MIARSNRNISPFLKRLMVAHTKKGKRKRRPSEVIGMLLLPSLAGHLFYQSESYTAIINNGNRVYG